MPALPVPELPALLPEALPPAWLAFWAAVDFFRFHSPSAMFSFWLVTSLLNCCWLSLSRYSRSLNSFS